MCHTACLLAFCSRSLLRSKNASSADSLCAPHPSTLLAASSSDATSAAYSVEATAADIAAADYQSVVDSVLHIAQ